ncbi:MAG TPA: hypothetical protein VG722_04450, partial [Tepidisphaeraceae bacterium]|nr:hypothetical protein [Tepidisphaeraceae bacterium]
PEWRRAFDLVLESYTLQVLPSKDRNPALAKITEYVAPGGFLIVVARARDEHDPQGEMPWPLTRTEMDHFKSLGLSEILFEDYVDQESPAIRRFRACYMRP